MAKRSLTGSQIVQEESKPTEFCSSSSSPAAHDDVSDWWCDCGIWMSNIPGHECGVEVKTEIRDRTLAKVCLVETQRCCAAPGLDSGELRVLSSSNLCSVQKKAMLVMIKREGCFLDLDCGVGRLGWHGTAGLKLL
ncbi:hypothetical protein MPTK1_8g08090 [Marchantia polymorpha subsp. ruderalis]|uniref:Uncharacterized protein n=1 Tax=Marchantia polymorpha TaxID=3197 RepID=A0A2R6W4F8_MARPO|nr:hypothetical protein MARPO_0155s0009 [Marchantia polymorpha]BBN19126.1 hypothetical protein Mp_8g08090 [Marchantia polymorpha subsp. ruderalis]|eukprot:PTQ28745.1 hypothetical protein MARPO_0155s0009 [Marchantia polymorpha]